MSAGAFEADGGRKLRRVEGAEAFVASGKRSLFHGVLVGGTNFSLRSLRSDEEVTGKEFDLVGAGRDLLEAFGVEGATGQGRRVENAGLEVRIGLGEKLGFREFEGVAEGGVGIGALGEVREEHAHAAAGFGRGGEHVDQSPDGGAFGCRRRNPHGEADAFHFEG